MKSKQVNLWLEIFLAMGLVMTLMPGVTGIPVHQGIGSVLGIGVVVHLLLHCKWMVATSRSFIKLPGTVRFKLVLNILSLLAFSLTIVSGLMNAAAVSSDESAGVVIQRSDLDSGAALRADRLGHGPAGRELGPPMLRRGAPGFDWHVIHHASALLTSLTVALHLALHRAQIGRTARRFAPSLLPIREIGS